LSRSSTTTMKNLKDLNPCKMKNNFMLLLTVICLLFLHVRCSDSEPEPNLSEDRGTFVTEIPREFYSVQWSNAGDEILYTNLGFQSGVFALDLNSGERRTLHSSSHSRGGAAYHFTQSVDGQTVYFFSNVPPDNEAKRLYAVNIDGSGKRVVIDSAKVWRALIVAPNHEEIAFSEGGVVGSGFGGGGSSVDTTFVFNLQDQRKTLIGHAIPIAFSPDSRKLWIAEAEFQLVNLTNNSRRNYAFPPSTLPIAYKSVAEDLYVLAVESYTGNYVIVDLATGESKRVWENTVERTKSFFSTRWFQFGAVSQDLTKFAYWDAECVSEKCDVNKRLLVVVDLNTGTETTVFTAAGDVRHSRTGWVAFSPDNKHIAYSFIDVNPERIGTSNHFTIVDNIVISVYKRDL